MKVYECLEGIVPAALGDEVQSICFSFDNSIFIMHYIRMSEFL